VSKTFICFALGSPPNNLQQPRKAKGNRGYGKRMGTIFVGVAKAVAALPEGFTVLRGAFRE